MSQVKTVTIQNTTQLQTIKHRSPLDLKSSQSPKLQSEKKATNQLKPKFSNQLETCGKKLGGINKPSFRLCSEQQVGLQHSFQHRVPCRVDSGPALACTGNLGVAGKPSWSDSGGGYKRAKLQHIYQTVQHIERQRERERERAESYHTNIIVSRHCRSRGPRDSRRARLLVQLDTVFRHSSNVTDRELQGC